MSAVTKPIRILVRRVFLSVMFFAVAGPALCQSAGAGEVRLGIPEGIPPEQRESILNLVERLQKQFDNRITFDSKIVATNASALLTDVRSGRIEMAFVSTAAVGSLVPGFKVYDSLFVFSNLVSVEKFQSSEQGRLLLQQLKSTGVSGIAYWHDGLVQFASTKDVSTAAALSGLTIATKSNQNSFTSEQFSALGSVTMAAANSNPLATLYSNRADAAEVTWDDLVKSSDWLKEDATHQIVLSNHRYSGYVVIANEAFLNKLAPTDRWSLVKGFEVGARQQNKAVGETERKLRILTEKNHDFALKFFNAAEQKEAVETLKPVWLKKSTLSSSYKAGLFSSSLMELLSSKKDVSVAAALVKAYQASIPKAFWNAWVDDGGVSIDTLESGRAYMANLDLSPYEYVNGSTSIVSGPVHDEIAKALASPRPNGMKLVVRVSLVGEGLEFGVDAKREISMPIDIEAFRSVNNKANLAQIEHDLAALQTTPLQLSEVSKKLRAGFVSVPIRTKHHTGCAQIVFSIWDEAATRPIDHVVLSIPAKASPDAVIDNKICPMPRIQGSFGSVASGFGVHTQVDAGLHIFQFQAADKLITRAIYVDAQKYRDAPDNSDMSTRGIYTWDLEDDLSDYIGKKLPGAVKHAREVGDYSAVAEELESEIFPVAAGDSSLEGARGASVSLAKLMEKKGRRSVLVVRAVMAGGRHIYAPLALLGAKKSGKLTVIYPLPRESYDESSCVERWAVGYPNKLEQIDGPLNFDESNELYAKRMRRLHNLGELKTFLDPVEKKAKGNAVGVASSAEALLLLAHQDDGFLWFEGNGTAADSRIAPNRNNKQFARGSVAFLSACSVANPTGENYRVVERFNRNGVDAIVASPFPVIPAYGNSLALSATRVIRDAYKQGNDITLQELFEQATSRAAKELPNPELQDQSAEFIIMGNSQIRLCKK